MPFLSNQALSLNRLVMAQLTPYEYDWLPAEVKAELAQVVRHPRNDQKSSSFRKRYGKYQNGDISGDQSVRQVVGYGTGSPLAPHIT